MTIFYYTWTENSQIDMMEALMRMGHSVIKCHIPLQDYEEDEEFTSNLERIFLEHECEIFLSFNFFPVIAKSAERLKKKYIAWVYDTPHWTLFSPIIKSDYVYVCLFDRMQYEQLRYIKDKNVFHMPLAVNTERLNRQLGVLDDKTVFVHDVSFVGSLYENNRYRQIQQKPDYLTGYVQGIIEAQKRIYGYDIIGEVLDEQVLVQLNKVAPLDLEQSYLWNEKQVYTDMIRAEVTHQERLELLKAVSEQYDFKLYTGSCTNCFDESVLGGILSYDKQMPEIFRKSKINLNITLRSITSGMPLRALDIMGAGGFLLSNYQQELAENFIDGEELVLFDSKEDMLEKIAYYLAHEDKRREIAYNGWRKVQQEYSYELQLAKIFSVL